MSSQVDPKRRAITVGAALALLGFPTITLTGCGGSSGPTNPNPNPTPTPGTGDVQGSISANHGHSAVVHAAELQAGNALTLHIMGQATHDHTVDLTGAEVVQIRGGGRVSTTTSSTQSHTHTVTFN